MSVSWALFRIYISERWVVYSESARFWYEPGDGCACFGIRGSAAVIG